MNSTNPMNPTNSGFSSQGVAQATIILMIGMMLSRILGIVREMVIAHMFGATAETDAFVIAFTIPGVFTSLVSGAITVAFIPVFTEYRIKRGEADAWRIASTLINLIVGVLSLGVIFTLFAAPGIVGLLAPGFDEQTRATAVHLSRVMSPAIVFMGLTGLSTAILNSYKHFTFPAFAGLLYNVGIIGGALLLAGRYDITGLALGVVAGGLAQLVVQLSILVKKRVYYTPALRFNHPGVKRIAWLVLPFFVSLAASQLNMMIDRILASGLVEGSIAALSFGGRVMGLPLGIFGAAIGTAVYPALSEYAAEGQLDQLRNTFSAGIRMLWFIIIPASVGLIVLREPIIRLLFERGAFDPVATGMTATALFFYSLGLFAHAGHVMLIRTFFSMQSTRTPVKMGLVAAAVNIILNLILVRYLALGGLALASSIAASLNFGLLAYYLRKKLGYLDGRRITRSSAKIIFASLVMGVVCRLGLNVSEQFVAEMASLQWQLLQVGGLVLIGALVYFAIARLMGAEELDRIWDLRHLFNRRG